MRIGILSAAVLAVLANADLMTSSASGSGAVPMSLSGLRSPAETSRKASVARESKEGQIKMSGVDQTECCK